MDTCLSCYFQQFSAELSFAMDLSDLAHYYREHARLIAHWRAVLPAERLIEIDYEDLTADPQVVIRRVVAFCGLPWDDACLRPELNVRSVNTPSKWQVRQPIGRGSVGRWTRYEPWLGPLAELKPA